MPLPTRSEEGTRKLMEGQRKGRTAPSNLREQVDEDNAIMENANNNGFERGFSETRNKTITGKTSSATGSRIQITLADEVMVEEIKANPQLMEQYKDYEMVTRKNLPNNRSSWIT